VFIHTCVILFMGCEFRQSCSYNARVLQIPVNLCHVEEAEIRKLKTEFPHKRLQKYLGLVTKSIIIVMSLLKPILLYSIANISLS
jgi:hypothetical protein